MSVITLTSDMGLKDYYDASVKAAILNLCPQVRIIDITHDIPPFDISRASFVLRNTYQDFPEGSVHIIGVDPDSDENTSHMLVYHKGHYFVGADNGCFALLFDEKPEKVVRIPEDENEKITFPTKQVFTRVACQVIQGTAMEEIGEPVEKVKELTRFRAVVDGKMIRGTVIYIDSYGNVISNISQDLFEETRNGRSFTISLRGSRYQIRKISEHYNEVPQGNMVALFSSTGYLEIAISKGVKGAGGGASSLFGLKIDDTITIEFHDS